VGGKGETNWVKGHAIVVVAFNLIGCEKNRSYNHHVKKPHDRRRGSKRTVEVGPNHFAGCLGSKQLPTKTSEKT